MKYTLLFITLITLFVSSCAVVTESKTMAGNAVDIVEQQQAQLGKEETVEKTATITEAELATHSIKTDCWIGYEGKAYDITSWLPRHPGESEAIEPYCGKSALFEEAFARQHGDRNVDKLLAEGIYKGELE